MSYEQLRDAASAALTLKLGASWSCTPSWRIVATFDDAVYVERTASQLEKYALTVDSTGKVTLGDASAAEIVYKALTEGRAFDGVILSPLAEKTEGATKGSRWAVVLIQEGMSANRRFYTSQALRGAAELFEGKPAYWTHTAASKPEPDPRDKAGFYRNCRAGLVEAQGGVGLTVIAATLHARAELAEYLQEAFDSGDPNPPGISINAGGNGQIARYPDGSAYRVDEITEAKSADIVANPAAGGRFLRLQAGMPAAPVSERELVMFDQKLKLLRESYPQIAAKLSAQPTEAEVDALLVEAATPKPAPPAKPEPAPAPAAPAPHAQESAAGLSAEDRTLLIEGKVDRMLKGRTLPEAMQASVRDTAIALLEAKAPQSTVEKFINEQISAAAKLTEPEPKGTGNAKASAEVTSGESDKYFEGLVGFFMHGSSEQVRAEYKKEFGGDAPKSGFRSLKEMYVAPTGDRDVTGRIGKAADISRYGRLMEAVGAKFQEAIGTGTLSNAFAASMNRRLVSEYRSAVNFQKWRQVVSTIQPLSDFRNQERVRFGHLGDLPIVSQGGAYTELADPTDEKVSYAPAKRGALVSLTREAIKNDDVGIVRAIPQRLALSAARTLNKFVFDFIVLNPTLDDSVALFAAAATRGYSSAGNLQTAALTDTTIGIARQRLLRVQDKDAKTTLGISPKILIVPPELEKDGYRFTTIPVYPVSGQNATEPNLIAQRYGLDTLIVLETMVDTNDYFIVADPRMIDTIEVGFVDGQEEPLILLQDQEQAGSVFTADKWTFKGRHEYGADVVDWRGFQGGLVP